MPCFRAAWSPCGEACDLPRAAGAGGQLVECRRTTRRSGSWCGNLPTPAALILEALLLNRIWPGNPVNRRYRCAGLDYRRVFAVEQPAGAFLMVRRAVWEELGGFDEGFFPLWFEDVDFCRRIRDRGYRLYYVPEAVAKHTGGHSIAQPDSGDAAGLLVSWFTKVFSQALSPGCLSGCVSGRCNGLHPAKHCRIAFGPELEAHGSLWESRAGLAGRCLAVRLGNLGWTF